MNKIINKAKTSITNQKKKYLFLTTILLIGMISGILFIFFISKSDKSLVKEELTLFFANINSNKINYLNSFINSFVSNLLYLIFIWILGISIIGIPIIIFLLFFKGFIFGFSFSSIIYQFGIKGIPLAISYQIPHYLINLVLILLISFYAINFSVKLFKMLFFKESCNLNMYFKKYNKIFIITIIGIIITSLIEVFIAPVFMNFFL